MTSDSEKERERLKEEYKEHYRKIRDTKEKIRRSRYVQNVSEAMQQMNADDLLSSVDEFLDKVRTRMATFEARLDVAMDQFTDEHPDEAEMDEVMKKEKARDTLRQIKMEMGLLYREIEQQAGELDVEKTVGKKTEPEEEHFPDKEENL